MRGYARMRMRGCMSLGALVACAAAAPRAAELSSALLRVGVSVDAAGAPSVSDFRFVGAGANTSNLALPGAGAQVSSSLLVLGGRAGQALVPSCGAACTLSGGGAGAGAALTLAGLTTSLPASAGGALLATETWTLTLLNASALSWTVDRVWAAAAGGGAAAGVAVDRLGLSLATTGGAPIHSEQIPGFVDLDMFLNESSTGGFDIGNGAFEYLSPHARQFVRFTPTGALFVIEGAASVDGVAAPLLWSFAKPFADGTTWCSIGFEAVDPRGGARPAFAAGTAQRLEMTLHLVETDIPTNGRGAGPFPALAVALPNATLHAQMTTLFSSQYQLMGWILGNNPASSPCLHEQAWWPMMASVLDAGSVAFAAMQQELSFFARCGWSPGQAGGSGDYEHEHSCSLADGAAYGLTQRYSSTGFYNCPWGPLTDQDVMLPIAVWFAATSSGDLAWLARMRPALDATAAYLASRGLTVPSSRAVFVSPASGIADGGRHAANWYDVILFGHLDAFLAVHGVWAMQCLSEIYAALGDAPAAAHAAAVHAQAVADFNQVFYNGSGARASYTDWIDTAGTARHYFYSDISFTAIIAGVANASQASALLDHYDSRLAEIYTEYNVTPGSIWSAPSNLYPITNPLEIANNAPNPVPFPSYENGGAFFHTPGLQFAALGAAGRADAAWDGFVRLMNSGFGDIRGWAQQLYWGKDGAPDSLVGGDPLNTAALSVWGFLRGVFGVAPTLTRGLVVVGTPATQAEGAAWNFSHLGVSVCITVRSHVAIFCNGSAIADAE